MQALRPQQDLMGFDLRFSPDSGLEQRFRAQRIAEGHGTLLRTEVVRATAWTIAAAKAYIEGEHGTAAGLMLGTLSSVVLLPLYALAHRKLAASPGRQLRLRLLFAAVVAANLLQCVLGLLFFQAIYPEGDPAAALGTFARLRACMVAVASCGVVWLVFYGRMSPLPFRYQWPQLAVAAAMMVCGTGRMCANANLQAGHAELHRVLRHLVLPMLLPATAFSLPDSGGWQVGPGPAACALCQTHQPAVVVMGLTAVLLSIYRAEAGERARLLRSVRRREQHRSRLRAWGRRPEAAGTSEPEGASGSLSSEPSSAGAAAGPAGWDTSDPAFQRGADADLELSELPTAAGQRAQAGLLAAAFVYIMWSSWPSSG